MPAKKKKPAQTEPLASAMPRLNRKTLAKLLDAHDSLNLTEVGELMQVGVSSVEAQLFSSTVPEGHPSFRYRLETVAGIAANLFRGGASFAQAAKDAIALLDACYEELCSITIEEAIRQKAVAQEDKTPQDMDFDTGIKYITGAKDIARAEAAFQDFVAHILRHGRAIEEAKRKYGMDGMFGGKWREFYDAVPETMPAELTEFLSELRRTGIPGWRAKQGRLDFEQWKQVERSREAKRKGALGKGKPRAKKPQKKVS